MPRSYPHPWFLLLPLGALYSCASAPDPANPPATAGTNPKGPRLAKAQEGAAQTYTPDADPAKKEPKYQFPKPPVVRGIYVTAWTAGGQTRMENLLGLLDRTELNSMVIDVRDDGEMYFDTDIPLADAAGAHKIAVTNPDRLMLRLQKRGVYPIARVACFRDAFVPKRFPDRAVQFPNGKPWHDRSGHTWLDPYNRKNWEYLAQTVDFAMDLGFPEIQLDYVRFPSEGSASNQRFPGRKTYPEPKALPGDVIARFCEYLRKRVKARNVAYSADIFGIISSNKGDEGIGQQLEKVAAPFDVISPMVYPSHFARGEYGIANPNAQPYAIIKASLGDFKKRLPKQAVRPWLQDFSLGHRYGAAEVKAQIKASREVGYGEYLMWNAANRYSAGAYGGPEKQTPAEPRP